MSEKLCTLRTQGGGGGVPQTETVLWTNPSPDSNFAGQTITLSESIDNFDYIKVTAKKAYNNSTFYTAFIVTPENFKKTLSSLGSDRVEISFTIAGDYTRRVLYVDNTSVNFSTAYKLGATGTSNSYAIPLSITGITHLEGKLEHYASGYFTTGRTSVDLGFVPKYVFCANGAPSTTSPNGTVEVYDANVSTTQYHMLGADVDEMRTIGAIGTVNQFCMEGTVIGMNPNQNFSLLKNSRRYYWAIG